MESSTPDHWPPSPEDAGSFVAPLFPLADVWLFPGEILPLHVFEPRYRQMVEDLLDGPGRIVMGTVLAGHEHEMLGAPPVYPIAGLGDIGRHDRLDDGRFKILLVGLGRVRVEEVPTDTPYRKVQVTPLQEIDTQPTDEELRERLESAVLARSDKEIQLPDDVPLGRLADLLTRQLPLPHVALNKLYCELDIEARARAVLAEHDRCPGTS